MGMITSDFYNKFGNIDIVEAPFTAGELIRMASVDVQEQFADWTEENDDAGYIPAHIMLTLLEDRAFFEQLSEWVGSYLPFEPVSGDAKNDADTCGEACTAFGDLN